MAENEGVGWPQVKASTRCAKEDGGGHTKFHVALSAFRGFVAWEAKKVVMLFGKLLDAWADIFRVMGKFWFCVCRTAGTKATGAVVTDEG